jgi:O-antigen/teichoic acid export membrane protein
LIWDVDPAHPTSPTLLAFNIGLNVVLIPLFGLWGAAIATSFAMIFEASALSFTVWRKLGIVMLIFVPAVPVARGDA